MTSRRPGARPGPPGRPGNPVQPLRPGQPRQPDPPERPRLPEPPAHSDASDHPGEPAQADRPAGADPSDGPRRGRQSRRRGRSDQEQFSDAEPGRWTTAPTPDDLLAAAGKTIPDLVAPGLQVLFCGINPSLYSAATGRHFARPGNRFWPALHRSGFTPRLLHPSEQHELLGLGLGVTNMVARASARADELATAELHAGGELLTATVARWRPCWLAVVGVTAYRTAFGRPKAVIGRQDDRVAGTPVWVLPNPSGLNAHYTVDTLATAFAQLRAATALPDLR